MNIGEGLGAFIAISIFLAFPLAIWKAVEIVIWIFSHVHIGVK